MEIPNCFEEKPLIEQNQGVSGFDISGKRSCSQICLFLYRQDSVSERLCEVRTSRTIDVVCFICLDSASL